MALVASGFRLSGLARGLIARVRRVGFQVASMAVGQPITFIVTKVYTT